MKYTISIDWLSVFGILNLGTFKPAEEVWSAGASLSACIPLQYRYKKAAYGTRQFKELWDVFFPNSAGGWDAIASVQAVPCSPILPAGACIVKFDNRVLYQPDMWYSVTNFFDHHGIKVQNISRIDICADFNAFASYKCVPFIADFVSSKLRHVGRGVGNAYFNHGTAADKITRVSKYFLKYTGLSFGTHKSDARIYLYNKTFELMTQKEKPWIRDRWKNAGLITERVNPTTGEIEVVPVWRLEVSLKAKALQFRDKSTGENVQITAESVQADEEVAKIYHTFVRKLFAFVKNRDGITNITREKRIVLFDDTPPIYDRGIIRNVSASSRTEKILIRALWKMSERYRGRDMVEDEGVTKQLADELATATNLERWFHGKRFSWDNEFHK